MIEDFAPIKEDFSKVGLAYHLCELVDGLCPDNQENRNVFFLLQKTLTDLSQQQKDVAYFPEYVSSTIDDYTLGTYGVGVSDAPQMIAKKNDLLQSFEVALLSELGYWNSQKTVAEQADTQDMIENILERKLKSSSLFAKLQ